MNRDPGPETSEDPVPRPLDGVLVVAVEQALAAPFCSCRLADAGARVIKVERPEGDFARGYDSAVHGQSAYFVWANRGKESIVLDLKTPDDASVLEAMLARADVFIQNLAPGATDRLGFGSDSLRERHPRLITCDISGYGRGPYRDMKAYDLLIQSESGLASITGAPEAYGRIGVSISDIGAGLNAANGILEALLLRERTGRGTGLQVSLFDSTADWMNVPLLQHTYGGQTPTRVGLHHPTIAPYGGYSTADGHTVVVAIQNEREWARFCSGVLDRTELAEDDRFQGNSARVANRPALDELIDSVFGQLDRAELLDRLRRHAIAFGAVSSLTDLETHPQVRRWPIDVGGQTAELIAHPVVTEDDDGEFRAPPGLGEHSAAIRAEFTE